MRDRKIRRDLFPRRIVIGLLLISLGVLFYLNNINYLSLERLWRFWPMILGVLALERFVNRGPLAMEGHILALMAALLQLTCLERYSIVEDWWPLAVVWLGIIIVLRALFPRTLCHDSEERPS
jgi:hypothetical protein